MFEKLANKFRRVTSNQSYMPEIDGLRFFSLTQVITFHIYGFFVEKFKFHLVDGPSNHYIFTKFMLAGQRRTPMFFVISGFILCLPFAKQYLMGGKPIRLRQYFLRRMTRIEAPYFIVMTILAIVEVLMHVYTLDQMIPSWGASLIYMHNIIFRHTPLITVVAWTLELEVQFYILSPMMFKILKLSALVRRTILASSVILVVVLQQIYPPPILTIYGQLQFFLVGVLLADLYICGFAKDFFRQKWWALLGLLVLLTMFFMPMGRVDFGVDDSMAPRIFFPFLIAFFYLLVLNNPLLKSIFSYKFVPIIGGMCYTTYLLHYPIISILGKYTMMIKVTDYFLVNVLFQFTLLTSIILFFSCFFFLWIERPFMDRKWSQMLDKWLPGGNKNKEGGEGKGPKTVAGPEASA